MHCSASHRHGENVGKTEGATQTSEPSCSVNTLSRLS